MKVMIDTIALVSAIAAHCRMDDIVTRNTGGFKGSPIGVLPPEEFLKL